MVKTHTKQIFLLVRSCKQKSIKAKFKSKCKTSEFPDYFAVNVEGLHKKN